MKTHRFDTVSFVSGLIFTGFGLMFLIPSSVDDLIDSVVDVGTWAWPLILLGVGLAILLPLVIAQQGAEAGEVQEDEEASVAGEIL
jgi:hypothetical protein